MRDPVVAVVESAADADDAHRQVVEHRAVAHEFVRAHRRERRDRVDEGHVARLGETGCDPDHVLLRHADVEEAVGKAAGEDIEHEVAEVARQQDDALVHCRQLGELRDEVVSHAATASSSDSAWQYCSSVIGR